MKRQLKKEQEETWWEKQTLKNLIRWQKKRNNCHRVITSSVSLLWKANDSVSNGGRIKSGMMEGLKRRRDDGEKLAVNLRNGSEMVGWFWHLNAHRERGERRQGGRGKDTNTRKRKYIRHIYKADLSVAQRKGRKTKRETAAWGCRSQEEGVREDFKVQNSSRCCDRT